MCENFESRLYFDIVKVVTVDSNMRSRCENLLHVAFIAFQPFLVGGGDRRRDLFALHAHGADEVGLWNRDIQLQVLTLLLLETGCTLHINNYKS